MQGIQLFKGNLGTLNPKMTIILLNQLFAILKKKPFFKYLVPLRQFLLNIFCLKNRIFEFNRIFWN